MCAAFLTNGSVTLLKVLILATISNYRYAYQKRDEVEKGDGKIHVNLSLLGLLRKVLFHFNKHNIIQSTFRRWRKVLQDLKECTELCVQFNFKFFRYTAIDLVTNNYLNKVDATLYIHK